MTSFPVPNSPEDGAGMYSMMMEYYSWVIRTLTRTADTAGGRLQQLMSTAVRGWARAEAASLGILSLTRDVIFASILLLYKLLVIAYRYLPSTVPYQMLH